MSQDVKWPLYARPLFGQKGHGCHPDGGKFHRSVPLLETNGQSILTLNRASFDTRTTPCLHYLRSKLTDIALIVRTEETFRVAHPK
jgi:hypothetical protein